MLSQEKGSTTFSILQTIGSLSSIVALYLAIKNPGGTTALIYLLVVATIIAIVNNVERFIKQRLPRCLQHLEVFAVDKDPYGRTIINGNYAHSLFIIVKNYELTNVRISGILFRPYLWKSTLIKERTQIDISPYAQCVGKSEKYPLKFGQLSTTRNDLIAAIDHPERHEILPLSGYFISTSSAYANMDYIDNSIIGNCLIFDRPDIMLSQGDHSIALLPLSKPAGNDLIRDRKCGIIDLKYKTDDGRRGLHRVRV